MKRKIIDKTYEPNKVEQKIYKLWEKSGYFNPDKLPVKKGKSKKAKVKNFCIIMPPPNANGPLHFGHALFVALEDIMIRYHRMKGEKTLWLPGADHAGFETQVVFDKKLEKEGRNRFQINREKLYKEMLTFTLENKKIMKRQLKKLGASCDWSREKFTLDKNIVSETQNTFIDLYNDGLVYRGERIVNWCVKHQTSLSDLEIKYEERTDPLYFIKYGPLELATVRPETKFGDTAVAVNPKDKRYRQYIGKEIEIETLLGPAKIKVIADEAVDPEFGTGAVKVTPSHDPADFEIWQRHKNEIPPPIEVIDKYGQLNEKTGPYQGMKIIEARKKISEDLAKKGLLDPSKTDYNYRHNVALCYKCKTTVEPRLIPQWFVKTKPLAKKAIEAVQKRKINFIPQRFEKVYFHWMKNIRDWNISRQIIWGIRIPAWFCGKCGEVAVSKNKPRQCRSCKHRKFVQDPDVFDTWFSSGQWPFLALGYSSRQPKSKIKSDYKNFYPTSVMETGWDILFFWVARMIMLGLYRTGKIPFKTVYLHGLVRDKDRKKMSKSIGNVIDPLGVAEVYGTDAIRMALVVGTTPGSDPIVSEEKIRGYRNFATKIWNVARFVLINYDSEFEKIKPRFAAKDKNYLKELQKVVKLVTKDMDEFRFHRAAERIYQYFWHTFADKIIEEAKPRLRSGNKIERASAFALIIQILQTSLTILHPFMPYITEEVWQKLPPKKKNLLIVEEWPK